jgi:hypothetical protein
MPRVLNLHRLGGRIPNGAVYIGRPSKWGNPFPISGENTRDNSVDKYREMVENSPQFIDEVRRELRGKDLVCFCAPKRCHGDILLQIANNEPSIEKLSYAQRPLPEIFQWEENPHETPQHPDKNGTASPRTEETSGSVSTSPRATD